MKVTRGSVDWQYPDLVRALGMIGGKWKMLIICNLLHGTKRFGELRRVLPGISRGVLSYELRQLHSDNLVGRNQYQTIPPTVEYFLTSKGRALEPILRELNRWTREYGASE